MERCARLRFIALSFHSHIRVWLLTGESTICEAENRNALWYRASKKFSEIEIAAATAAEEENRSVKFMCARCAHTRAKAHTQSFSSFLPISIDYHFSFSRIIDSVGLHHVFTARFLACSFSSLRFNGIFTHFHLSVLLVSSMEFFAIWISSKQQQKAKEDKKKIYFVSIFTFRNFLIPVFLCARAFFWEIAQHIQHSPICVYGEQSKCTFIGCFCAPTRIYTPWVIQSLVV